MSQISLKSISGITSITTPAGVDNQFTLHTNNTSQALKLDSAGNIHVHNHINTTGISSASNFKTGSSNLHSTGLTVGNNFLHSTGINVGTGATIHVPATNVLTLGTNSNERLRITSTGLVGINTAVPGRQLEVFDATQGTIAIKSSDTGQSSLWLSDSSDDNVGGLYYEHSNNNLVFRVNDNERLRIASAGQIGIAGANYGTSGQVLTSKGSGAAVQWASGPAMVLITTVNSSGTVSLIELLNQDMDVYRGFRFVGGILPATDGAQLRLLMGSGGGVLTASNYRYGFSQTYPNNNITQTSAQGAGYIQLSASLGNGNAEGWRGTVEIFPSNSDLDANSGRQFNFVNWSANRQDTSDNFRAEVGSGVYHGTQDSNGFRLSLSTGNIAHASYSIYGYLR